MIMSASTSKKPTRELSSITNHLLLTKSLNSLVNNSQTSTIKENMSKSSDNAANLLNIYHLLSNNNQNQLSSVTETSSSSSFVNHNQFKEKSTTKR